eukprot:3848485-Prymnesium_polylepis.1
MPPPPSRNGRSEDVKQPASASSITWNCRSAIGVCREGAECERGRPPSSRSPEPRAISVRS